MQSIAHNSCVRTAEGITNHHIVGRTPQSTKETTYPRHNILSHAQLWEMNFYITINYFRDEFQGIKLNTFFSFTAYQKAISNSFGLEKRNFCISAKLKISLNIPGFAKLVRPKII